MAKICNNVVCGDKLICKTLKGELICKTKKGTEMIMKACIDFDAAVDKQGSIHISAVDDDGNMIYIKNASERWGKGIISPNALADNIFVFLKNEGIIVFYTSNNCLWSQVVDNEIHSPREHDKISPSAVPFVTYDAAYYINKNGNLCKNGEEIYRGKEIKHIFASDKGVCFKERDGLKFVNTEDLSISQSLTRRHGKNAECPILVPEERGQILYWIDGSSVFSSVKKGETWQRLEEKSSEGFENIGIYKFCTPEADMYDIGYMKNNEAYRWGKICQDGLKVKSEKCNTAESIKEDFGHQLKMELLLAEIKKIHKKIMDIDGKIELIKKEENSKRNQIVKVPLKSKKQ